MLLFKFLKPAIGTLKFDSYLQCYFIHFLINFKKYIKSNGNIHSDVDSLYPLLSMPSQLVAIFQCLVSSRSATLRDSWSVTGMHKVFARVHISFIH